MPVENLDPLAWYAAKFPASEQRIVRTGRPDFSRESGSRVVCRMRSWGGA